MGCLGPLGRGFQPVTPPAEAWMVAGGVGLAPFASLTDALMAAGDVAEQEGQYAAKQDMKANAPSGNIKGKGPCVCEVSVGPHEGRRAEAVLCFFADKTGPGAYNFPLVYAFAWKTLALSMPKFQEGFTWKVIDMAEAKKTSWITLQTPTELPELTMLLKAPNRFAVEEIRLARTGDLVVSASTDRLHKIGEQKYVGKDDPNLICRVQGDFLAPEEVIAPYKIAHLVPGGARGTRWLPLTPVALNTPITGPGCQPAVCCIGFSVSPDGKLMGPVDYFGQEEYWGETRHRASEITTYMESFAPFEPATLEQDELEYSDYAQVQEVLLSRFQTQ